MNIVVLIKQTFDTEEKIKLTEGTVDEDGVKFVINPYDEYAVEEAIRLREAHAGKVTVVSLGHERCAEALRTALAMGADEAVRIEPPAAPYDEAVAAALLSACVCRLSADLILGGFFSVDQGSGQVAIRVASRLGIPHISAITKLEISQSNPNLAIVERDVEGATETAEVELPALFTAQQGLNEPRYPSLPGIMKARKKPFQVLQTDDLGLEGSKLAPLTQIHSLTLPPQRKEGIVLRGEIHERVQQLAGVIKAHVTIE
ncbi:MAG: EtfB [Paenibacillus sp.]|nr:EtfB [Paenibacillus sp.]